MSWREAAALVVAARAAWWLIRITFAPYAPCPWCGGSGRNPFSGRRRHGDCWFCHGTRRRMVLGARTVHRALQAARDRRRKGWGR